MQLAQEDRGCCMMYRVLLQFTIGATLVIGAILKPEVVPPILYASIQEIISGNATNTDIFYNIFLPTFPSIRMVHQSGLDYTVNVNFYVRERILEIIKTFVSDAKSYTRGLSNVSLCGLMEVYTIYAWRRDHFYTITRKHVLEAYDVAERESIRSSVPNTPFTMQITDDLIILLLIMSNTEALLQTSATDRAVLNSVEVIFMYILNSICTAFDFGLLSVQTASDLYHLARTHFFSKYYKLKVLTLERNRFGHRFPETLHIPDHIKYMDPNVKTTSISTIKPNASGPITLSRITANQLEVLCNSSDPKQYMQTIQRLKSTGQLEGVSFRVSVFGNDAQTCFFHNLPVNLAPLFALVEKSRKSCSQREQLVLNHRITSAVKSTVGLLNIVMSKLEEFEDFVDIERLLHLLANDCLNTKSMKMRSMGSLSVSFLLRFIQAEIKSALSRIGVRILETLPYFDMLPNDVSQNVYKRVRALHWARGNQVVVHWTKFLVSVCCNEGRG